MTRGCLARPSLWGEGPGAHIGGTTISTMHPHVALRDGQVTPVYKTPKTWVSANDSERWGYDSRFGSPESIRVQMGGYDTMTG